MAASVHVRASLERLLVWRARFSRRLSLIRPARITREAAESQIPREYGVNLVGYFHCETGVGQSVRAARAALETAPVPLSLRSVEHLGAGRKQELSQRARCLPSFRITQTSSIKCGPDDCRSEEPRKGILPASLQYRLLGLGLDEFPERWQHAFAPYREIWTPSSFCRQAVGRKASIPVFCVPYSVAPVAPAGMDREYFGLAPDKFLFLTAFDVLSVTERKNPLAAIRAFGKAFGPNSGCQLIVKVDNARAGAECVEQTQERVRQRLNSHLRFHGRA